MTFIGYEKDFKSVETSAIKKALRIQGVEEIYMKILEDIY